MTLCAWSRVIRRRSILWLLALTGLFAVTPLAGADAPFLTDDPVFSPGGEIKAGITGEHNAGGSLLTEVLDWNYALVPSLRLNLTTYTKHVWPAGGGREFGYGDTEFKIKWRFLDEDVAGGRPALGIAPKVFVPTADERRGLGDGAWRVQLPLLFGMTVGRWYHFAEAGYQWVIGRDIADSAYGGAGSLYAFTDRLALGAELFSRVSTDRRNDWQLATTLGAVYTVNASWQIKASVSHTLRETARGGPSPAGVVYVVWNF
jgi:hypothetical protein